ncbi:hypothetical protein TcasGA2_TC031985 [Tribolium castaneum]|uniref:Uncharacterized protein n=1 Tax=Tribolium castaneum TaxID=7070 RepID=A0A139WNG5_TRICA|nr:hypothetical protein TcasGA2_TC031985 [Tribolium castaneum]
MKIIQYLVATVTLKYIRQTAKHKCLCNRAAAAATAPLF